MGRRDADPRPEVELWGAEAGPADAPRTIQVGGRRSRRAPLVAVVAAVALIAGGLALGGDDDESAGFPPREERDNSRRTDLKPPDGGRTTTTQGVTSTTLLPAEPGPMLGRPTGGSIVLIASGADWRLVELDTGIQQEIEVDGINDSWGHVPVAGGLVVLDVGGRASFRPVPEGDAVPLGSADEVLPSGVADRVWLLRFDPGNGRRSGRLVDLTGNELMTVEIPLTSQAAGTATGLAYSAGGRTYLEDSDDVRLVTDGELLGATADAVVVLSCDEEAQCGPDLVELETGRAVRLEGPGFLPAWGIRVVPSSSGELAVLMQGDRVASLAWYARDGRLVGQTDLSGFETREPAWLPGDLGLLIATSGGSQWIHLDGGGTFVVERVPDLYFRGDQQVYLINR